MSHYEVSTGFKVQKGGRGGLSVILILQTAAP